MFLENKTGAVLNRSEFQVAHLVFGFSGRALVNKKALLNSQMFFFSEFSVFYNTNIFRFVSQIFVLLGLAAIKLAHILLVNIKKVSMIFPGHESLNIWHHRRCYITFWNVE